MKFEIAVAATITLFTLTGCNSQKLAGIPPQIDVEPTTLVFQPTLPGSSDTQTTTITNRGGGVLTVSGLDIGGLTPTAFGTDAAPGSLPMMLSPGGSLLVQVKFAPGENGPHAGVLTVASDDPQRPSIDVQLTTASLAPAISVAPQSLDFGTVSTGLVHLLPFTVSNVGNAPLTVSTIELALGSSAAYTAFPPTLPTTLAPGGSFSVPVAFAPSTSGALSGSVTVASDDPIAPSVSVALTGNGTPALVPDIFANPTSLAFGNVERFQCRTLTTEIGNQGLATLVVSNVHRSTATSAEYTATPTAFSLAPGQFQTLSVTYCPTDTTVDNGSIIVASNDPDTANLPIGVSGTGIIPAPTSTNISIELTWNVPGTDVDLHLLSPGAAWASAPGDCYYGDCVYSHPDWGIIGNPADDPYLDHDVINGGGGPENINLTLATTGTYRAAAFYYGDHSLGPTSATMKIWLNGVLVYTSAPQLIVNRMRWDVADIVWDASTNTGYVVPVGTTIQMFMFTEPAAKFEPLSVRPSMLDRVGLR